MYTSEAMAAVVQASTFLNSLRNGEKLTTFPRRTSLLRFQLLQSSRLFSHDSRREATSSTARAASTLPDLASDTTSVLDLSGNSVALTDLWKGRTAVVGFARHFGCILCRKRADILASKKDVLDKAGVALVLIGPGSVDQARAFVDQTKFPGEVYADPSHSAFEAFKFASGASTIFNPKAGLSIIRAHIEGYRQDWGLSFEKDTVQRGGWQQGGIVVAGPGKERLLYIHKDKEAGDDPDMEEVISACCMNNIKE